MCDRSSAFQKQLKMGLGSCTEEVLEWFNYPVQALTSDAKLDTKGVPNRPASSLRPCRAVASLPSLSSIRRLCNMWVSCCRWATLWTRIQTRVCETLLPDVVVPEAHQNDRTYVHALSWPTFDSLCKTLARQAVTRRTSQIVKIRGWALARENIDTQLYI